MAGRTNGMGFRVGCFSYLIMAALVCLTSYLDRDNSISGNEVPGSPWKSSNSAISPVSADAKADSVKAPQSTLSSEKHQTVRPTVAIRNDDAGRADRTSSVKAVQPEIAQKTKPPVSRNAYTPPKDNLDDTFVTVDSMKAGQLFRVTKETRVGWDDIKSTYHSQLLPPGSVLEYIGKEIVDGVQYDSARAWLDGGLKFKVRIRESILQDQKLERIPSY